MNDFDSATSAPPSAGTNWFDMLTQAAQATASVVSAIKGKPTASNPDGSEKVAKPASSLPWYKRPVVWAAVALGVLVLGAVALVFARRSKPA